MNRHTLFNELLAFFKSHEDFYVRQKKSANSIELLCTGIARITQIKPNVSENNPLSVREMVCLILLAIGMNPAKCADLLNISPNSVATYEERIRRKLGAYNRTHAFYLATTRNYILFVDQPKAAPAS